MTNQLFCSVDLEFTGFDPSRDQILEIGFAFFRMTESGAEVTEQWSQVFKPSIEVHPKILGLTGITLAELDAAPPFDDHREFLQQKLGDAIIVGHNPTMDVKFLESYGIKLSGQTIDTLELVQFLLPTHHSYNLENLVHFFGIEHTAAHRALGDSISTIAVLEKLVRVFRGFDADVQSQVLEVAQRASFLWTELLKVPLSSISLPTTDSLGHLMQDQIEPLVLSNNLITIDEQSPHHEARAAKGLANSDDKSILVVEDVPTVMRLWKAGLAQGLFGSEDVFSKEAFEKFLEHAVTPEEIRFALKIIVWLHTNWQTETVFDLNISFFGGQFRSYIVGGQSNIPEAKVVVTDYKTFDYLSENKNLGNRRAVICNLQSFEKFISTGNGTRVSWNSLLYCLRVIYNPETDFGNKSVKDEVLAALTGVDLFFALSYLLLHKAYPQSKYVALSDLEREQSYLYSRLQKAAVTLKARLEPVLEKVDSVELKRVVRFLDTIFVSDPKQVRWVSLDEDNTSFHDQPLDVSDISQKVLSNFKVISFTDTIVDERLLSFHVERLGLNTELEELFNNSNSSLSNKVKVEAPKADTKELLQAVQQSEFPILLSFPELSEVKNFYNEYYAVLKEQAAVFAQGYSGGGNKMFRNFSINPSSILLATPEFVAKQTYSLPAKTVLFTGLPIIEDSHPYIRALLDHWQARFPDLHNLLVKNKLIEVLKKISVSKNPVVKLLISDEDAKRLL